jgi:hypothetical protein
MQQGITQDAAFPAGFILFFYCLIPLQAGDWTSIGEIQPDPAAWERKVDGVYEHRGVAKIEQVSGNYLLTIYCHGIHSVYIKKTEEKPHLHEYLGQFVQAHYTYMEQWNDDIRCIRTPCGPMKERRVVIREIKRTEVLEDTLENYKNTCSSN